MPSLQDIEQFKASLKSLGKEAETLSRWGESWQDLEPPPQGVPDDLAALLDTDEPETLGEAAGAAPSPVEDDFASFLSGIDIDDAVPASLDEPAVEASDASDGFELPAAFEDSPEPPSLADDDFSVPPSLLAGLSDETAQELDAEVPGEEQALETDDFAIPDSLLGDLEEAPAAEADSLDGFSMPDLEEAPAAEPDSLDGFSMPDLEEAPAAEPRLADEAEAVAPEADFGFSLGSESPEEDSFDQFDLGGTPPPVPDIGEAAFSGQGDDIDGQLAALDGAAASSDTFSLEGDWGGDFTIPGFEMGFEEAPSPQKPAPKPSKQGASLEGAFGAGPVAARAEKPVRAVDLSEEQVDALQDTLLSYPLNLRLAVEDIIANAKGSEAQQSELVWLLVEGALAKDAAKLAGKILKRYIEVPSGFAKRTGAAFEADKGSFRYVFVHSIIPILKVLFLVSAASALLFYLGYTFAYRPLKANSLYAEGHRQIGLAKYGESMTFFDRADKTWSMKGWHYRYAEAYADSGQYPRAEAMYQRLLRSWPKEKRAAMDYARMELDLFAFKETESVLQTYILNRLYFDKDALSLSALNYLSWADFEEQAYDGPNRDTVRALYEKARLQLATLMERHGRSDAYLEMMLLYLIRTERSFREDKLKEIRPLAQYAVDNSRSAWSSATLAELGDYLLDRDEIEQVNRLLLKAIDADGTLPEAHATMARWNRRAGFPRDELKALEFAARFYAEADRAGELSPRRIKGYIASMMRLGELRRADGRSLDAEDAYNIAIGHYERAIASRQFKPEARFGRAYALLADIYYADRMDFTGALALYDTAEANGFISPETDYRRGYMHYNVPSDDGSAALKYFYRAGLDRDASPYLLWATANALYARDDFFAAQGYYSTLAARLQFELDTLSLPSPQQKPSHGELVELLMMTRNNLGASTYRVAVRMGDARRRSIAMVEFTESARLFDALVRDQKSMIRPETKNLGFLNVDYILHPQRGIDILTYKILPSEMAYPRN